MASGEGGGSGRRGRVRRAAAWGVVALAVAAAGFAELAVRAPAELADEGPAPGADGAWPLPERWNGPGGGWRIAREGPPTQAERAGATRVPATEVGLPWREGAGAAPEAFVVEAADGRARVWDSVGGWRVVPFDPAARRR